MTTTLETDRRGRDRHGDPVAPEARPAIEVRARTSADPFRDRLEGVHLVSSAHLIDLVARGEAPPAGTTDLAGALARLGDAVPTDLARLVLIFDGAPSFELAMLPAYLAEMAAAPDSAAERRGRAVRAFDVAVRRAIPAVLASHGCREFSTELARLEPVGVRSLAAVLSLLEVVAVQIDRRIGEWFGRQPANDPLAAALFEVRHVLIGSACRFGAALIDNSFETLDPWEGPALAVAAAGQAVGWDEISWWEFFGPVLELAERPAPIGEAGLIVLNAGPEAVATG